MEKFSLVADNNIIQACDGTNLPYCAYGDESKYKDLVVYAFVVFPREKVKEAEGHLNFYRKQYNFPPDEPIHCSVLLHESSRAKKGLSHLSHNDVRDLIRKILFRMKKLNAFCRFAYFKHNNEQKYLVEEFQWNSSNGEETQDKCPPLKNDPKLIQMFLRNICLTPAPNIPPGHLWECFISEEKTLIEGIGGKKHRAHSGNFFSDIHAPESSVFQFAPNVLKDHPLLQVADICAYMCSHASVDMSGNDFFTKELSLFPYSRAILLPFD